MDIQGRLIREPMLHEFHLSHNTTETSKNICFVKDGGIVDRGTITRWLKKIRWGCKKLEDQARSGKPKTVASEVVFQVIEVNPTSISRSV